MKPLATALKIASILSLAACDPRSATIATRPPVNQTAEDTTAELHRLVSAMEHHPALTDPAARGKPIKVSTVIVPKAVEHRPHHH